VGFLARKFLAEDRETLKSGQESVFGANRRIAIPGLA